MDKDFITKLQTDNFFIGSFAPYIEKTKSLIKNNSSKNISNEKVDELVAMMPLDFRGAILDKSGKYIGYIGLYNDDFKNNSASIRFETNTVLTPIEKNEILTEYKKFLHESLNVTKIKELVYIADKTYQETQESVISNSNIIITNKLLIPGVLPEDLEKFKSDYSIPNLAFPCTIKRNNHTMGIIGLSGLLWSNRRATLNIFLDKSLGEEISKEVSGYIIDDYIDYVHEMNIHNVVVSVGASNQSMINILKDTNMNYYGQIPFSSINGNILESSLKFQHIPNMKRQKDFFVPEGDYLDISMIDKQKEELSPVIDLENNIKMISPKVLKENNIDFNRILQGHIESMQNRESFTMPLGEDKYIIQKDEIIQMLMDYDYVVIDGNNNYLGYINSLDKKANGKHIEIEMGIKPGEQHKGLGTMILNKFYEELFSTGVVSVTGAVFEFNEPSIKLNEKVANFNGTRLESYYINGKLWDMNYYTKTNESIEKAFAKSK